MPRGDRTGPQGQGPMTGRGLGKCSSKGGSPAPLDKAVRQPAGVKAGDQAKAPSGVRAKAEVPDKAEVDGLNKSKALLVNNS